MARELVSAWRRVSRKPAVPVLAALSLALGIGATAAIFGALDGMYLRPLAVSGEGEVVRVFAATDQEIHGYLSYPEYREIRDQARSLSGAGALMRRGAEWLDGSERRMVVINAVSPDFFDVLGVRAQYGRVFGSRDTDAPVVVLGQSAWKRWFGADPTVAGRTIRLSRGSPQMVTILGVLPPSFRDIEPGADRDMWMPEATFVMLAGGNRRDFEDARIALFETVGRLRPGATVESLRAELDAISRRLAATRPDVGRRRTLTALSDFDYRMHLAGTTGKALFALVILVAAIACINVANLLLSQVDARSREMATRSALGASARNLTLQVGAECLLIGAAGIAGGLLIGTWLLTVVPVLSGFEDQSWRAYVLQLDQRVLGFSVLAGLAATVAFGLAPAMRAARTGSTAALVRSAQGEPGRQRVRRWLAISQLALSAVLLSTTGMLARSLFEARHGDIGITRANVLTAWQSGRPAALSRDALERVRALPGVRDATIAFRAPLSGNGGGLAAHVVIPGHPEFSAGQPPAVIKYNSVESRYFRVLGIPVLRGRAIAQSDVASAARTAVVSQTMARRYWPEQDPIGQHLRTAADGLEYEIVGVVADAPINNIGEIPEPYFYTSFWQHQPGDYAWLVRTDEPSERIAPALRATLASIDPELARVSLASMDEIVAAATTTHVAAARLVGALALLGLVLAAVGLYGVMAAGVTARTREIGIRIALGARNSEAAGLVVRDAARAAMTGLLAGVPAALAANAALRSMLFGVAPWYPPVYLATAIVLFAVAVVAAWSPARRAAAVDPMLALRIE